MTSILVRCAIAFVLLTVTFNPTRWNYFAWARENFREEMPLAVLLGLLLLVGYVIYFRATLRSIGLFGMILVAAIVAALIWVLHDWGVLALGSADLHVWLGLIGLSAVLGVGLSWSIVRRSLSGQVDMDDVEE